MQTCIRAAICKFPYKLNNDASIKPNISEECQHQGIKMMDLDNGHIKKKKCLTRMQIKLQQK